MTGSAINAMPHQKLPQPPQPHPGGLPPPPPPSSEISDPRARAQFEYVMRDYPAISFGREACRQLSQARVMIEALHNGSLATRQWLNARRQLLGMRYFIDLKWKIYNGLDRIVGSGLYKLSSDEKAYVVKVQGLVDGSTCVSDSTYARLLEQLVKRDR